MNDPRLALRDGTMRRTQWAAVVLCALMNVIDGYDIVSLAVSAPSLAAEWGLRPATLGALFSAGVFGMAIGALAISPLADIWGRRPTIILCLSLMSIGMAVCSLSPSTAPFAVGRILNGIGMGGIVATSGTLALEYASQRRRAFAVAMVVTGFPLGSLISATLALSLLQSAGWPIVFALGAGLSTALLPVVWWVLPESLDYLVERSPKNALSRANRILARMGMDPIEALPQALPSSSDGLKPLMRAPLRSRLLRACIGQALNMFSFYFIFNWGTKWVSEMGLPQTVSVGFSMAIGIGGIVGGLLVGWATNAIGLRPMTTLTLCGVAACIIAFPLVGPRPEILLALAAVLGASLFGSAASVFSTIALAFPAAVRATGGGIASTCGRIGATIGPLAAGILQQGGMDKIAICFLLALPAVAAAATLWGTPRAEPGGA